MKNKNVAIVFDDLTEFFVMRDAIDAMLKEKIPVDIIVPYDSGYNGLAEHTYNKIKEFGYSPKKDTPKNKTYKILLTPYPILDVINRTNYVYHLGYQYGAISTKPDPTYLPEWKLSYDGILVFNTYEPEFLSAYGVKYHILPYWKYHNFKRINQKTNKPVLLFLPTFGSDISSIKLLTPSIVNGIKEHYYIISKAHHATHFNSDQDNSFNLLKDLSDEFYDSDTELSELLSRASLVLSDNSGAIFDSVCAGIPVAIFSNNLNGRKLDYIDTVQYRFVKKGIFPSTNNPNMILSMLQNIEPYIKKQSKLKNELFIKSSQPIKEFIKIIQHYLSLDPKDDYFKQIHSLLLEERNNNTQTINQLKSENQHLNNIINNQQKTITDLLNSTSWKITKPLRTIKSLKRKG